MLRIQNAAILSLHALSDLPLVFRCIETAVRLYDEQVVGEAPVLPTGYSHEISRPAWPAVRAFRTDAAA